VRACSACSPGVYYATRGDKSRPVASVLVLVSTVGGYDSNLRKQKTSGSLKLCSTCLEKLASGKMPKKLRDGIRLACVEIGLSFGGKN
jgi:hypothetical protein